MHTEMVFCIVTKSILPKPKSQRGGSKMDDATDAQIEQAMTLPIEGFIAYCEARIQGESHIGAIRLGNIAALGQS